MKSKYVELSTKPEVKKIQDEILCFWKKESIFENQ